MATSNQRFVGLNTEDRLGMLRRAWNAAPAGGNTLLAQLQSFAEQASALEDEDLQSSSSNSHSATSQMPGAATAVAAEKTRAWYQIIEGFQTVRQFLMDCANYGQDAFQVQYNGCFPTTLPAVVPNPVTLDLFGKWARLVNKYGDDFSTAAMVINVAVGDPAIYLWLLANPDLLNITKGVTEQRGDYGETIIGRSGGTVFA